MYAIVLARIETGADHAMSECFRCVRCAGALSRKEAGDREWRRVADSGTLPGQFPDWCLCPYMEWDGSWWGATCHWCKNALAVQHRWARVRAWCAANPGEFPYNGIEPQAQQGGPAIWLGDDP